MDKKDIEKAFDSQLDLINLAQSINKPNINKSYFVKQDITPDGTDNGEQIIGALTKISLEKAGSPVIGGDLFSPTQTTKEVLENGTYKGDPFKIIDPSEIPKFNKVVHIDIPLNIPHDSKINERLSELELSKLSEEQLKEFAKMLQLRKEKQANIDPTPVDDDEMEK